MRFLNKYKFLFSLLMVLFIVFGINFNISGILFLLFVFWLGLLTTWLFTRSIFKDIGNGKMAKKVIKKLDIENLLIKIIREMDFQYFGVNVEYDYIRNCIEEGCDTICRCGKIKDIEISVDRIKVIEYLMEKIISCLKRNNVVCKEITEYCIERILKNYNLGNRDIYYVDCGGGYYGEEIYGVFLDIYEELVKDICLVLKNEPIDSIKFILEKEYGYLTEVVKNSNNCCIEEVNIKDLVVSNTDHYVKLDKNTIDSYKNYKLPIGIYVKGYNKYRIIDGYHRYQANINKEICKIIVIE